MTPDERIRRLTDPARWNDDGQWGEQPIAAPRRRGAPGWTVMLGAAAAVAVIVVGASQLSKPGARPAATGHATRSSADVPWVPSAASGDTATQTPAPCKAGELTASGVSPGVTMGAFRAKISVTNSGPVCALPAADVTLVAGDGAGSRNLATSQTTTKDAVPLVGQNETVDYYVTFDASCTAGADGQQGTIPLSLAVDDQAVRVDGSAISQALVECRSVALVAPETSATDVNRYPTITASLTLPETAPSGAVLSYTVALRNTGPTPVHFDPCPEYSEVVNVYGKGRTARSYALNCTGVDSIPAGGTVTFAMQAPAPAAHGPAKVGWFLGTGGPSTGGSLTLQ